MLKALLEIRGRQRAAGAHLAGLLSAILLIEAQSLRAGKLAENRIDSLPPRFEYLEYLLPTHHARFCKTGMQVLQLDGT